MFENRLKEISSNFPKEPKKEYFILTHEKHKREVYFQNNKKAVEFIEIRLSSPFKKIVHFLIRLGILQIFLKKIKLSSKFGDAIFVGGQIKSFDLKEGNVLSFPLNKSEKSDFFESKKIQQKIFKKGFAPEIFELDKNVPFSKEELLKEYEKKEYESVFKRLYELYEKESVEKISIKNYMKFLFESLKKMGVRSNFITKILNKFSKNRGDVLIGKIHGDFSKEQILLKGNSYVFTDWDILEKKIGKGLIIRDLVSFFRREENLLKNINFKKLLKIYPKEVRENIKTYLILNEIYNITRRKEYLKIAIKRIENIFKD